MRDSPHSSVLSLLFSSDSTSCLSPLLITSLPLKLPTSVRGRKDSRSFLTTTDRVTLEKSPIVRTFEQVATGASPSKG